MALLKPNYTYKINGLTVNEKIIPDGTRWKDSEKAVKAGFSANALYKKQKKISGGTGKPKSVTIHNTNDLDRVEDDGEQYTRATYNENMNSVRVNFYVDDLCAWQEMKAGTGMTPNDPEGSAEVTWHAGDGSTSDGGNMTSLSIEIIMNDTAAHDATAKDNGARLTAWLLWKHGLTIDNVVSHTYWVNKSAGRSFADVDEQCTSQIYGKKWCPTYIFGSAVHATALKNWKAFKALVKDYLDALNGQSGEGGAKEEKPVPDNSGSAPALGSDYIGKLVKVFESGSKGSLALGSCGNDWGLSCGSYQMTLRWGNCISFLKNYFPSESAALYFNSSKSDISQPAYPGATYCSSPDDVKAVWTACYNKVGAAKFFACEHDWIRRNYYEPILKKLASIFNPNRHSRMAQECLWSWSVHKGSTGAYNAFKEATGDRKAQETAATVLLDLWYDTRYAASKTTRYKKGAGASSEREVLRPYCTVAPLAYAGTSPSDGTATGIFTPKAEPSVLYRVQCGAFNSKKNALALQNKLVAAGYTDAFIRQESGLYKVQVGAYKVKTNADELVKKLKAAGFQTYIKKTNN